MTKKKSIYAYIIITTARTSRNYSKRKSTTTPTTTKTTHFYIFYSNSNTNSACIYITQKSQQNNNVTSIKQPLINENEWGSAGVWEEYVWRNEKEKNNVHCPFSFFSLSSVSACFSVLFLFNVTKFQQNVYKQHHHHHQQQQTRNATHKTKIGKSSKCLNHTWLDWFPAFSNGNQMYYAKNVQNNQSEKERKIER